MNMQDFLTFMYNSDGKIKDISDIDIKTIIENGYKDSKEYKIASEILKDEKLGKIYDDIMTKYYEEFKLKNVVDSNKTIFENLYVIHEDKKNNILNRIDDAYSLIRRGTTNEHFWIKRFNYKFFEWRETTDLNHETDKQIDVIKIGDYYVYKVKWLYENKTIVSDKLFLDFNKENQVKLCDMKHNNGVNNIVTLLKNELRGITCSVENYRCSYDYNQPLSTNKIYKIGSFNSRNDIYLKPLHLVSFNFSSKCIYLTNGIERKIERSNGVEKIIAATSLDSYIQYKLTNNGPYINAEQVRYLKEMYLNLREIDPVNAETIISLMFPQIADEIILRPIEKVKN